MKFVPPFGRESEGDAAHYINGNPVEGRQGSIPPAAVFEHPQREILNVITRSQIVPSETDLAQLAQAVRSQRLNWVEDTGSDSNLSVVLDPPLTSYTRGLTLRVRVRNTNTSSAVRINAGPGSVFIRRMNGADVGEGQLPAGAVATLVFDGTVFQLSNFGGVSGGEGGDIFTVNIPFAVDSSTIPGTIIADFHPPITELSAGDVVAVQIANANEGPTIIHVNSLAPIVLKPNGGQGRDTLQGDVQRNDIVILFFDGTNFWFPPNPEINAPVTYTVGPSQQFPNIPDAMDAMRRKTIGAKGFVTFRLAMGTFQPFTVSHPSGDRIRVEGTMRAAAPVWSEFASTGISAAAKNQDAVFNINLLRSRFGTEIDCTATNATGIANRGPGRVQFANLLIVGARINNNSTGVGAGPGYSIDCTNVCVWGCHSGFNLSTGGSLGTDNCFSTACPVYGFFCGSMATFMLGRSGMFGSQMGFVLSAAAAVLTDMAIGSNDVGIQCQDQATCGLRWSSVLGNGLDLYAAGNSSIPIWGPTNFQTLSPALGVVGNSGALISYNPNVPR